MEQPTNDRINRMDMYFEFVHTLSKRSTCLRKKVGAILTRENRVVAMGYNGVLPGMNPLSGIDPETGESRTVHAEANLIAFCAKNGITTEGCDMYISLSPCIKCAEIIIQSGIRQVYYQEEYRDNAGIMLLLKHEVLCHQYTK